MNRVGKPLAEGLAIRIVRGDVPDNLKDRKIFSLDMAVLSEPNSEANLERLKAVLTEVKI